MLKKLTDLEDIIATTKNIDVIILTESWLKEENAVFYNLHGYTAYHICRKDRRGGGVSMFIKDNIKVNKYESFLSSCEILKISVTKNGSTVGVYNHNYLNINNCLNELLPLILLETLMWT